MRVVEPYRGRTSIERARGGADGWAGVSVAVAAVCAGVGGWVGIVWVWVDGRRMYVHGCGIVGCGWVCLLHGTAVHVVVFMVHVPHSVLLRCGGGRFGGGWRGSSGCVWLCVCGGGGVAWGHYMRVCARVLVFVAFE